MSSPGSVAVVTLGCARNEVDSSELAGRLEEAGWTVVQEAADADVALVNTCAFVAQAKKDSIDVLLEAADLRGAGSARTRAVVAVGCLAQRYGATLAEELPEADAVLGFDAYADLPAHLSAVLRGERLASHVPVDRRRLLPVAPAQRGRAPSPHLPGHQQSPPPGRPPQAAPEPPAAWRPAASGPRIVRRLDGRPWAPLKIASGCDRRCAFCAIPSFRGAFVSRDPDDLLAEARWLAAQNVRELLLVSENSTSYGKDLGDLRLLDSLLPRLAEVEGVARLRVSYLQPAEVRPALLDAMCATPCVAAYFDLSFQHASPRLLRRMRRFGGGEQFLDLLAQVRGRRPDAGVRSNVIVGFPGETEEDVAELAAFLEAAQLDVVGVFGYSDEDGTEGERLDGHLDDEEIEARATELRDLVEQLTAQRAADRVGSDVSVLVEEIDEDGTSTGRSEHQGPDVDGVTRLVPPNADPRRRAAVRVGDLVPALVVDSVGVDLVARIR